MKNSTPNILQIAIDGFSSCGKSTLARDIANALDIVYIDSGAMYRAVSLYLLENNIDFTNESLVSEALDSIEISFKRDQQLITLLNNRNVENEIRSKRVNQIVSPVATLGSVRSFLVSQQQRMSQKQPVVMDGRDIGTVVLPNAQVKLFVTADINIRVQRRFDELIRMGRAQPREEVKHNLLERDQIDSSREINPLRRADDAIDFDNSQLNRAQQLNKALTIIEDKTQRN